MLTHWKARVRQLKDDLLLVPAGILLARRLIPPTVLADCREEAAGLMALGKPLNWLAAAVIVLLWLAVAAWLLRLLWKSSVFGVG